jgi:tellurite resistance protein
MSKNTNDIQEGLMLCMLLTSAINGPTSAEELREMAIIASEEPEFTDTAAEPFDKILERAQKSLHSGPEKLMETIERLLSTEESRRRGLELATRVVVADGIVQASHVAVLEELAERFDLPRQVLEDFVVASQRRLVRFMMVYLIYFTATADGDVHPEEFEEMIPFALNLRVFRGISSDQFRFITNSVRAHLQFMKEEWGLDYICGTLLKATELLHDDSIPQQALRLVARGIIADGEFRVSEREFFLSLAKKLKIERSFGEQVMEETMRETKEAVKKL